MHLPSLKVISRSLLRNKTYTLINVFGLALGLAAYIFILQYVSFEQSVNAFHKDAAITYRLLNDDGKQNTWGEIEPGYAPLAKTEIADITDYCRFEQGAGKGIVQRTDGKGDPFREQNIGFAEKNFFSFFSFKIIDGKAENLRDPYTVFVSRNAAKKYFGSEDVIGKSLKLSNQFGSADYTITGVYEMPVNNDINYDMVFSLETLANPKMVEGNDWADLSNFDSQFINTCFKLRPGADPKKVEQQLTAIRRSRNKEDINVTFRLQPLLEVHLGSSLSDYYATTGNLKYSYLLGITGILILMIAWFNYINLSTANALKRSAEVGIRKVVGASRASLVTQFIAESLLLNVIAAILALVLIYALQPWFNQLTGKQLSLQFISGTPVAAVGLCLLAAGSIGSGAITAWRLSGFNPIKVLKGRMQKLAGGIMLRKALVVSQFAIGMALIMGTVLIYQQLQFMQEKTLTKKQEAILVFRGPEVGKDSTYTTRRNAFVNALRNRAGVSAVSQSGNVPGGGYNFITQGFTQPSSKPGDEQQAYSFSIIDENYVPTYGFELVAGRNFTSGETNVDWNDNSKVMLNETAVRKLGFANNDQAVRTNIKWDERYLQVVGVVKDYHHTGLQRDIDPIIFYPQTNNAYTSIKLGTTNLQSSVQGLQALYKQYFPSNPVEYFFADEYFNRQYEQEMQYGKIFTLASVLAIVIACLGLFGLTTFTLQQRTRELGIRKVLGASAANLVKLIASDFFKPMLIASVIAIPLTWYAVQQWLANFAYRISINPAVLAGAAILVMLVALITIGVKSLQSAKANPVHSIRTE